MGDGIVNQHMREDLEKWLSTLGLDPSAPINVIGYFGQSRDLSIFERVPRIEDDLTESSQGEESVACGVAHKCSSLSSHRLPVYIESDQHFDEDEQDGTPSENSTGMSLGIGDQRSGDIDIYLDRSNNTLMLQHSYLYDSQEMMSICHESIETIGKDRASLTKWLYSQEFESHRALLFLFLVSQVVVYTSTELTIDPRIISILLALSTTKRQIMQEMDRFMTICWDRIGVTSPDQRKQLENGGHHSGSRNGGPGNSGVPTAHNIFTPGKCVPVLVFVVERVPITAPWFEANASEAQIMDQLRLQLKKSVDAVQTRLRYVFKACRLLQSIDTPGNTFDGRQLFVLPVASSTPFVHVIPYFTGILNLPQRASTLPETYKDEVLDPAEAVLRQKKAGGGSKRQQQQLGAKGRDKEKTRDSRGQQLHQQHQKQANSFGIPSLEDVYTAIVQAKDKSLAEPSPGVDLDDPLTLTSIYMDYTGPALRQFLDGWIKATTAPGGYGSIVGKRSISHLEIPTLQQWLAGYLGVCEALGVASLVPRSNTNRNSIGPASSGDESLSSQLAKVSVSGGSGDPKSSNGREVHEGRESGGRRLGNGKRYSQRCSNMVQKKLRDFVQSDEVMEEL
ncbi:hypothetical protein BGZ81_003358 [Podila clonocystis]|nr:hypothetical protein BGZ81_003358 [Podila clonocystis]